MVYHNPHVDSGCFLFYAHVGGSDGQPYAIACTVKQQVCVTKVSDCHCIDCYCEGIGCSGEYKTCCASDGKSYTN